MIYVKCLSYVMKTLSSILFIKECLILLEKRVYQRNIVEAYSRMF